MKNTKKAMLILNVWFLNSMIIASPQITFDKYIAACDEPVIRSMVMDAYEIEDSLKSVYQSRIEASKDSLEQIMLDEYDPQGNEGAIMMLLDDKPIGFCVYDTHYEGTNTGHIYMIQIAKEHRKGGYGEKLLSFMINKIHQENMESVSLCAHPVTNSAAIKLYKKLGFELVGEQANLEMYSKRLAPETYLESLKKTTLYKNLLSNFF